MHGLTGGGWKRSMPWTAGMRNAGETTRTKVPDLVPKARCHRASRLPYIRVFLNLVEPRMGRERNRLDRLLSM